MISLTNLFYAFTLSWLPLDKSFTYFYIIFHLMSVQLYKVHVSISRIMLCKWVDSKSDLFPPEARHYLKESVRRDFIYLDKQSHRYWYVWSKRNLSCSPFFSAVTIKCLNYQHYQLYEIAHHNSCKTAAGHHYSILLVRNNIFPEKNIAILTTYFWFVKLRLPLCDLEIGYLRKSADLLANWSVDFTLWWNKTIHLYYSQ